MQPLVILTSNASHKHFIKVKIIIALRNCQFNQEGKNDNHKNVNLISDSLDTRIDVLGGGEEDFVPPHFDITQK